MTNGRIVLNLLMKYNYYLPAILAVMKHIMQPETKALPTTVVMESFLFGAIVQSIATIIPTEQGFAKPHIANVVMAELRAFQNKKKVIVNRSVCITKRIV